jgi:predicted DsbA family dithiol-disulfide isomerase
MIGKKFLNKAITEVLSNPLPGAPRPLAFSVIRVPYFLEPHYDENKPFMETNRERLVDKWGGRQGWERQKRSHDLKGRGLEAGIPHFNLDRKTSNTMASHRLIQHIGKTYGLATSEAIYDLLNQYYFVDGHALNDRPRVAKVVADELTKILPAGEAPLEGDLLKFMNGNEGRREIEQALAALAKLGVHGIPKFIIEGNSMVDGAARSDVFVKIFRDIERRGKIHSGAVFAEILGLRQEVIEQGSHRAEDFAA